MLLYHVSNCVVSTPRIIVSDRKIDFGTGFYTTSDYMQTRRWAYTVQKRKGGNACINVYEFDSSSYYKLNVKHFDSPNREWLEYTANYRHNDNATDNYDIVSGPVANDKTAPVIALYFAGIYDTDETIKRLLPQKLNDQIVFKTEAALSHLIFKEVITL